MTRGNPGWNPGAFHRLPSDSAGIRMTLVGCPAGLGAERTDLGVVAVAAHTVCERTRKNEDQSDLAAQCRPMVASPGQGRLQERW